MSVQKCRPKVFGVITVPRMDISTSKVVLTSVPHLKKIFLLVMMLSFGFAVFLMLNADPRMYTQYVEVNTQRQYEGYELEYSSAIRTAGCRIPLLGVDDETIIKMAKSVTLLRPCTPNPLLGSNRTHIWVENTSFPTYNLSSSSLVTCCYKSFYRPKSVDDIMSSDVDQRVKYNSCRNFTNIILVEDEFVRVTCGETKELFDSFFVFPLKKKVSTESKKDLPYNILILGLDSVSRLNLHRTMPKTVKYLSDLGAVELMGYNKVADNTFPNLMPLLLGESASNAAAMCFQDINATFDNCPFVWKLAQKAGFATAMGEDTSRRGTFNFARRGFIGTPTDYYLHPFIHEAEGIGTNIEGQSKLCINEKFNYKVLLQYVDDLTTLENKLFGFFWEVLMSHDQLNYPMAMDDDYRELFMKMNTSGYLSKTIIFLMSDHGMRFGKFRFTKQGSLEDRLPFVIALMPPSFRSRFNRAYNNLKLNSRRLTTPYDIHATLSDLLNLDSIKDEKISSRSNQFNADLGISLFLPVPEKRTCKSAGISNHWCTCYRSKKIDRNSNVSKAVVEYVLSYLNNLLEKYPQCSKLLLDEVLDVTRLSGNLIARKGSIDLSVVLRTKPGGGMFEATLGRESPRRTWSMAGSVSRVNLYGNQSYCVPIPQLKLYCYCKI